MNNRVEEVIGMIIIGLIVISLYYVVCYNIYNLYGVSQKVYSFSDKNWETEGAQSGVG